MVSVIAVDLDGTLLRSDGSVSPRTLRALGECAERGWRLVVATGRRPATVVTALPPELVPDAIVYNNGCGIQLDDLCIHEDLMQPHHSLQIVQWIEDRWPDCALAALVDDAIYLNREQAAFPDHPVAPLAEVVCRPAAKLVVNLASLEGADGLHQSLPLECKMLVTCRGEWGEIMPARASKARGLQMVVERWGLTLADVVAFGDDNNDLEMIAEAGMGVAMANAAPGVISVADRVTLSNDEDGVAQTLEALLRGEI